MAANPLPPGKAEVGANMVTPRRTALGHLFTCVAPATERAGHPVGTLIMDAGGRIRMERSRKASLRRWWSCNEQEDSIPGGVGNAQQRGRWVAVG